MTVGTKGYTADDYAQMGRPGKSWYDMTQDERDERNREHLAAVERAEANGPRYCRMNEGHACSSGCGWCGRCCDCKQTSGRGD